MKRVAAGIMSNGCFSHLLRGVWLLWLWQGKTSLLLWGICLKGLQKKKKNPDFTPFR